uniref:Uncharacterized protein n=1 Tax=Oryzias latipes TaxID=8090 RepID=A0A3B3HQV1_ORYLA
MWPLFAALTHIQTQLHPALCSPESQALAFRELTALYAAPSSQLNRYFVIFSLWLVQGFLAGLWGLYDGLFPGPHFFLFRFDATYVGTVCASLFIHSGHQQPNSS